MRKLSLVLLILMAAWLMTSCSEDRGVEPQSAGSTVAAIDPEFLAGKIMMASGWEFDPEVELPAKFALLQDKGARSDIIDFERTNLVGNIFHYSFTIHIGPTDHDKIRLHRVVEEQQPYQPIRTSRNIFLQHGDAVGFVKFLYGHAAPSVPDHHAVAIYLAQNQVDVWGIDQNWVLVPAETSDFSFMADWGMQNQIENLRLGLATARFLRHFTGSGDNQMHLLGYSSGGWLGFAYLNDEAAMPASARHVKGFVNADAYFKPGPDNEDARLYFCSDAELMEEDLANGVYNWWVGFAEIGEYALIDPDGVSPLFPDFTNLQVALLFGAATWRFVPYNEWFHYWGGEFDGDPEDGSSMPIDTRFLPVEYTLEFMMTASPWQAMRFFYDYAQITCDEMDVPWDDNIADITVPILNFGGAGGLAPSADYSLGLLGSTNIEHVIVQQLPDDQKYEDFGHIDLWTADKAPTLAWQPLLQWIRTHDLSNGVSD